MATNHTPKITPAELSERLRTHSERVRNVAWENLRNDLIDAAGMIDRQSKAIKSALEQLEKHDAVEGNNEVLDDAAETLRGAHDD